MKNPRLPHIRPLLLVEFFRRRLVPVSLPALLPALIFLGLLPRGVALPTGADVRAGQVDITQLGNTLNIAQGSAHAIVNWQQFNIAQNELVRVLQSGADAAMLARVTGGDPSQLLGQLKADGKLFLINPNGIVVGQGAVIDTAAFLASTLDVADADFLRGGALTFQGDSAAGVVNLGRINAREGNVLLIAHTVKNAGEISAAQGTAGLAAGTEVWLASPDAPTFVIKVNLPATNEQTGVENSGVIAAAQAELKAAGGSIYHLAVNQAGLVQATGVEHRDGRIILTAEGGRVAVTGSARAHNFDGSGGTILVGGGYRGTEAGVANATDTTVGASAQLDASASRATAAAGRVIVWADQHTAFHGSAAASGVGGGFAEISGKRTLDFRPADVIDLGRDGMLLLDPDALVVANTDPGTAASFTSVATLQAQLAASNVTLDTSTSAGDITFSNNVAWANGNTLRVNSGNNINLNADLTGGSGSTLELYAGKAGFDITQGPNSTQGRITQSAGSTLTVGTLTVGLNASAAVPNNNGTKAGNFAFSGVLDVGTLQADVNGEFGSLTATHSGNKIGTLKTTGTGGDLEEIDVVDGNGGLEVQLVLAGSDAFRVQAVTPGTLTLKSGTNLSFASQADVVLASTGGNFVNEAGAGAFGANARSLIYSGTSGATVKGGLAGTEEFSRTYTGNPPGDYNGDTTSRFLYRAAGASLPQLTYRASDASRQYGYADPVFGFTVTGEQPGLAVASHVSGAPALSTTATATSSVGLYTIAIAQGTLASTSYDFNFVNGSLTISAAPLTFAVNNASRVYGDANPSFSLIATGLRNGEGLSAAGDFSFSTSATALSNVADYAISASYKGGGSGNYSIGTITDGTLSVTKAPLTVTAPSFSRVYGQGTTVDLNAITYTGLKNGADALTSMNVTTAPTGSGVGMYDVTISGTSTNYDPTFTNGQLTITPAALSIRADDVTRTYGDANPALTATTTGLVNADSTTTAYSGLTITTAATQASNVGTYSIIPSGATGANYDIGFVNGTFTIERAILNATVADATRTYSQANPAFALAALTGFKNGDDASVLSGLSFSTTANSGSLPGYGYDINATATAQNYSFIVTPGRLSVTKSPVLFSAGDFTKVYGTTLPFPSFTLEGVRAEDELQFRGIWQLSNPDSLTLGVGTYALDWPTRNESLATYYRQFYDITFDAGSLTVTPAPLTLVARSGSAQYGTGLSTNGYEILGLRAGDTASVISGTRLNEFSLFSTAAVGDYPVTFASAGTAANYTVTAVNGELTVTPRQLSFTAPTLTSYQGVVPPLDPVQPVLVPGGPQFRVAGFVPNASERLPGGVTVPINLRLIPAAGTTLEDITRSYSITANPGSLTFQTIPDVPPGMVFDVTLGEPVMKSPLEIKMDGDFTLDPSLLVLPKEDPVIRVTDYRSPLSPADFGAIITGSTDRFKGVMEGFRDSSAYKNDYTPEQRKLIDDFLAGTLSVAELASRMQTDATARDALLPIFGSYAMDLVTHGTGTSAERRLVYFMGNTAGEQRKAIAAKAEERYHQWVAYENEIDATGFSTLTRLGTMPDIVTGAQTDVLTSSLSGAGVGAVFGSGLAASMTIKAVAVAIFAGGKAATAVGTATAITGPVAVVGAIAVLAIAVSINSLVEDDKNRAAYQQVMDRAKEVGPPMDGKTYFKLSPPANDMDRLEVMSSFLQVFGTAFATPN